MSWIIKICKILIIIISLYIIYLLIDNLPDYIKYSRNGNEGEEAGLNAMIITFLVPLFLLVDLMLIVAVVLYRKRINQKQSGIKE
ncbi:hypothetical protein [Flavobacterium sp. '19STA2R22 D10 B1']|uniref:hypothetical protein n=1 Tax=Flavobacterium aerium TaxID=3037261 RepID=UPI00278BF823|nr:hypothetical protein [Flavobacterium sp. '19STA2R22 D10 B1']